MIVVGPRKFSHINRVGPYYSVICCNTFLTTGTVYNFDPTINQPYLHLIDSFTTFVCQVLSVFI